MEEYEFAICGPLYLVTQDRLVPGVMPAAHQIVKLPLTNPESNAKVYAIILMTDTDLVNRFCARKNCPPKVGSIELNPPKLVVFLRHLVGVGFTHATIDPEPGNGRLYPITRIIDSAEHAIRKSG